MASIILPINETVFKIYAVTASVLVGKMLLMSPLTSRQRIAKKVFANPEDASYFPKSGEGKVTLTDPDVERVRRAHLNDLEGIPMYLIICCLYVLGNPCPLIAKSLMILYTMARIGHTLVYAVTPKPQPARVIFWSIGYGITILMTCSVFWSFLHQ